MEGEAFEISGTRTVQISPLLSLTIASTLLCWNDFDTVKNNPSALPPAVRFPPAAPRSPEERCRLEDGKAAKAPTQRGLYLGGQLFALTDIVSAQPGFDKFSNAPIVEISFTAPAAQRLELLTASNTGSLFPIFLDGKLLACPRVYRPIYDGQIQITGDFSSAQTSALAKLLDGSE